MEKENSKEYKPKNHDTRIVGFDNKDTDCVFQYYFNGEWKTTHAFDKEEVAQLCSEQKSTLNIF